MKFELKIYNRNIHDEDLIQDLKRVTRELEKDCITFEDYHREGKYTSGTLARRFGTWNKALIIAGLKISNRLNITIEDLFENLEEV